MPELPLSDGATITYQTRGTGRPVLLITGTALTVGHWPEPVLGSLADRHAVTVFDNRGTGASSPYDGPVTMRSLAADAAALLDHLDAGPAHVIGWSLGSAVAQHLALDRPDLVGSLVLYGTWARADGFGRALITALRAPWAAGDLPAALTSLGVAFSPEALDDPAFATAVEAMAPLFPHTPEQVAATVRQWDANLAHDTLADIPRITAPTTVLVGEQDLITPPRAGRIVADAIPGAEFVLVEGPGSSHGMVTERTDDWLRAVHAHLARTGAVAATGRPRD